MGRAPRKYEVNGRGAWIVWGHQKPNHHETTERNEIPGDRRYPPAPDWTEARSEDGGAGPVRTETGIPADQRSGQETEDCLKGIYGRQITKRSA